jgi:hypothetical protein
MSQTQKPVLEIIDEARIKEICTRLTQDKKLREVLPGDGWLHIDRQLPFLCVYRRPPHRSDVGTEQLVTAESSYLVAPGERHFAPGLTQLIENIVKIAATEFGAFLIIEVWSTPEISKQTAGSAQSIIPPAFRIVTSKTRPPPQTNQELEESLKEKRKLTNAP